MFFAAFCTQSLTHPAQLYIHLYACTEIHMWSGRTLNANKNTLSQYQQLNILRPYASAPRRPQTCAREHAPCKLRQLTQHMYVRVHICIACARSYTYAPRVVR